MSLLIGTLIISSSARAPQTDSRSPREHQPDAFFQWDFFPFPSHLLFFYVFFIFIFNSLTRLTRFTVSFQYFPSRSLFCVVSFAFVLFISFCFALLFNSYSSSCVPFYPPESYRQNNVRHSIHINATHHQQWSLSRVLKKKMREKKKKLRLGFLFVKASKTISNMWCRVYLIYAPHT